MSSATTNTHPSIPQILHALILALIPFVESLYAEALRTGRPISPSLRRLARTLAGFRALAALFGVSAPASTVPEPARRRTSTQARLPARDARPPRLLATDPTRPAARPPVTPEPARTLEL